MKSWVNIILFEIIIFHKKQYTATDKIFSSSVIYAYI